MKSTKGKLGRKLPAVALAAMLGAAGLVAMTPMAAMAEQGAEHGQPWQEGHQRYEFKHPLRVTCTEFIETTEVYRPFIVAWLSGFAHHLKGTEVIEEGYAPISIPVVVEECRTHPGRHVSEVVESIGPGHQ